MTCQNVVCIRLVRLCVFVIRVSRTPSNSSKDNNHLSQFILNFSVDREIVLIGDFNLPSINRGNSHPFLGHFEPTIQALVDALVSSGLSQWVTESTVFRSRNILDLGSSRQLIGLVT